MFGDRDPEGADKSSLPPLMFILFTNDLPTEITEGKLTLFADDTTHLIKSSNLETLNVQTNAAVYQIEKWSRENNLVLNHSKTAVMRFQEKRGRDSCTLIWMNNKSIVEESETKLLGVIIDKELNWKSHIDMVCKKMASCCFLIKKWFTSPISNQYLDMALHFGVGHRTRKDYLNYRSERSDLW